MSDAENTIQDILCETVSRARGLDYAAYAVACAADPDGDHGREEPKLVIVNQQYNPQLTDLLRRFACATRTADRQVQIWHDLFPLVHKALVGLDHQFVDTGQGENVRVVFDIDMGGFYYTRLGSHAVLFGATLDQEEVNNGRCEREMHRMVGQLEAIFTAHGA
jgi:hypothetical protein